MTYLLANKKKDLSVLFGVPELRWSRSDSARYVLYCGLSNSGEDKTLTLELSNLQNRWVSVVALVDFELPLYCGLCDRAVEGILFALYGG